MTMHFSLKYHATRNSQLTTRNYGNIHTMQNPYPYPAAQTSATPVDPIISRLRPRDMMGILDQSFRLYRRHFWVFVAIIAVVHVPIQLLVQASNIFLIGSLTRYSNPYSPYSPGFGSEPSSGQAVNDMFSNLFVGEAAVLLLGLLYGLW